MRGRARKISQKGSINLEIKVLRKDLQIKPMAASKNTFNKNLWRKTQSIETTSLEALKT